MRSSCRPNVRAASPGPPLRHPAFPRTPRPAVPVAASGPGALRTPPGPGAPSSAVIGLTGLRAPSRPAPGRRPMDEGVSVLRRPLAYVALIPLAWAVWVLTGVITHSG